MLVHQVTFLTLVLENFPGEAAGLLFYAAKGAELRDKVVFVAVVLDMADLSMCAGPLILQMRGSAKGAVEVICGRPCLRIC